MKNVYFSILALLVLSCNDNQKAVKKSQPKIDTLIKSKKAKIIVDEIYNENEIKIYGDTTIDKKKIYYSSRKFEPYISFNDFKVNIENIKNASLDLNSNELGQEYRTAILSDYNSEDTHFAGHYSISYWGCGAPCKMSVIIDRRTGKIYDAPNSELGYKFKADSRMLIVNPPDSLGFYDDCSYCIPKIYILNEQTKKFELRKPFTE